MSDSDTKKEVDKVTPPPEPQLPTKTLCESFSKKNSKNTEKRQLKIAQNLPGRVTFLFFLVYNIPIEKKKCANADQGGHDL